MFSLVHKKTTNGNNNVQNRKTSMFFEFKTPLYVRPPIESPPPQPKSTDTSLPKMKWGRPIWTFFHVMAEKIKPEYFNIVIKEYLQFIVMICGVLPCPICSQHASEYLRAINFNNIKTKDDLINLFFTFHNVVNVRKGYQVLQKNNMPAYGQMNTVFTIKQFMTAFEDRSRAMKLMADDMARMRIAEKLKFWINSNIQYFEP
jgi:hypothetical protein